VGASYFHDAVDGDFLAEIKPRVWERVICGGKITLSDLHETAVSTFYKKILNSGGTTRQQNAERHLNH
jgi:hypothetical protein